MQVMFLSSFGGNVTENSDAGIVLLEIRKVFKQRFDTLWAEENQHVVEDVSQIREITGYGLIHDGRLEIDFLRFQEIDNIFFPQIRTGNEKTGR